MKNPSLGELWLDEGSYWSSRHVRLLLVTEITEEVVHAIAIGGGMPGPNGIPLHYFGDGMTWQGYWTVNHAKLPRLVPPYAGHPMFGRSGAYASHRLHGTAALADSILPSWSPDDVELFGRDRKSLGFADLGRPIGALRPEAVYLKFHFSGRRRVLADAIQQQNNVRELWYQKQQNAWHLVRTLAPRDIELP